MVDVNVKVPALEKLLDYTASGIGAVAGPMLAPWKARKEAEAKRIGAKAEADSLRLIADAQAEARRSLVAPGEAGHVVLDLGPDGIAQRIEFQEKKRQANIASVVREAAAELDGKEVLNHEPDPDWTARFFNDVQDVSSIDLRKIWSRILAGEVESPGRTSLRTLSILKDITQKHAEIFSALMAYTIDDMIDIESYKRTKGSVRESTLIEMTELGLMHGPMSTFKSVRLGKNGAHSMIICDNILVFEGHAGQEIEIYGFGLTTPGKELAQFSECEPCMEYLRNFAQFLADHKCTLKIAPFIGVNPEGQKLFYRNELRIIEPAP